MHSTILPDAWVVLKFPSGHQRLVNVVPNTTIHIGKFGFFPANAILFRPYHLTYELLDGADGEAKNKLRIIPSTELITEQLEQHQPPTSEPRNDTDVETTKPKDDTLMTDGAIEYDIVADDGTVLIRSNRLTIDDPTRQKLSYEEIEALKKAEKGGGKDIIAAILKNHAALDEKTSFSLQKYTVRKKQKYLRRFNVVPLDVAQLCHSLHGSDARRILEIREETLDLLVSWSNARKCGGRWLVVDDTGGLLVAALAERMGLLYLSPDGVDDHQAGEEQQDVEMGDGLPDGGQGTTETGADPAAGAEPDSQTQHTPSEPAQTASSKPVRSRRPDPYQAAQRDTITLIHPAAQPNISILRYFGYPPENQNPAHPLHSHLKTMSWLSLLSPESDPSLREPEDPPASVWTTWKSGKQSTHRKKRRRWERTIKIIAEIREGGYDGLVVASGGMDLAGIFKLLVPLVKGGGQVVCFGPTLEPMAELTDLYSRDRRAAFTALENERLVKQKTAEQETITAAQPGQVNGDDGLTASTNGRATNGASLNGTTDETEEGQQGLSEKNVTTRYPFPMDHSADRVDFPVNPLLLLAPTLQTVRAKHWQVLPGRTHPQMMEQGGAEGYVFTATRVIPAQGKIEAQGRFQKGRKRKAEDTEDPSSAFSEDI